MEREWGDGEVRAALAAQDVGGVPARAWQEQVALGVACFRSEDEDLQERAAGLFAHATSAAGEDAAWAAAVGLVDACRRGTWVSGAVRPQLLADTWGAALTATYPEGGPVTCDPTVFAPTATHPAMLTLDPGVGVRCARDVQARAALAAAGRRFFLVEESGAELGAEEEPDEDTFTVEHVSGRIEIEDVLGVTVDLDSVPRPLMARTMIAILAEELRAADAVPARMVPLPREVTAP